jgi:pimeloyl-ACP methyl ester carboxylesterase
MRRLAGNVKNGRASIYPEAGHAPFYDQANRFNEELLAFAKSCHMSSS